MFSSSSACGMGSGGGEQDCGWGRCQQSSQGGAFGAGGDRDI